MYMELTTNLPCYKIQLPTYYIILFPEKNNLITLMNFTFMYFTQWLMTKEKNLCICMRWFI